MRAFLLMMVGLCAWTVTAVDGLGEPPWRPHLMSVRVGAGMGRGYEITYDRRELRYYAAWFSDLEKTKPEIIKPTEAEWLAFHQELEKLRVWKWQGNYEDDVVIFDGPQWDVCILTSPMAEKYVVASGTKKPDGFREFLEAIRKLIGGREFPF